MAVVAAAFALVVVSGVVGVARTMEARRMAEYERDRARESKNAAEAERQRSLLEQAKLEAQGDPTGALLTLRRLRPDLEGWAEARLVAIHRTLDAVTLESCGIAARRRCGSCPI